MRVIGYSISDGIITNTDGETCNKPPYLEFLLTRKPESIKVFWNLSYNIANLLKLINVTKEEGKKLQSNTELFIPPYRLRFIPGKFFSVHKNVTTGFFNDASQYFKISGNDFLKSPFRQATEAKEIGEKVFNSFNELGLQPKTITSPVAAYEKAVLSKLDLPTVDDLPEEAGLYAYNCCKNNWVEAFKIGHFEKAYDFDLNSAYPYQLMHLLDTREGEWKKRTDLFLHDRVVLGYYRVELDCTSDFHPFLYSLLRSDGDSRNYTPRGERTEEYLTLKQIYYCRLNNLGKINIIDGWSWIPNKDPRLVSKPLKQQMSWLYSQKLESYSNPYKLSAVKRVMAGVYGKLLQQNPESGEFGKWFNPVWAAEVECNNQIAVADFAIKNEILPISIAVDGLISDKYIDIPVSNKIGDWRYNGEKEVLCVGSGTVAIKGEKGEGDFSLDFDWLKSEIEKNPEATEYQLNKMSPITLAVAINENKWKNLGELHEVTKTVDIRYEEKRCYKNFPKNGRELLNNKYESEAWDIGTLIGREII